MRLVDESSIGVRLWFGLVILVNAYWITSDLWLSKHGHELMTTEFKEGLRNQLVGPLLCFVTAGTVAAFTWHMWHPVGK